MARIAYWLLLALCLGAVGFQLLLIISAAIVATQNPSEWLYALWWLVVLAASCVVIARGVAEHRAGRIGAACGSLAMLAVPATLGIGFYLAVGWYLFGRMG